MEQQAMLLLLIFALLGIILSAESIDVGVLKDVLADIRFSLVVGSLVTFGDVEEKDVLVNSGLQNLNLIGFQVFAEGFLAENEIFEGDILKVKRNSGFIRASGLRPDEVVTVEFLILNDNVPFNITFTGQELLFSEDTFVLSQCNCDENEFPNLNGDLVLPLSVVDGSKSQCAFPKAGIESESEFQLRTTLSTTFLQDEKNSSLQSSWVGYLVLEAEDALNFENLQLIHLERQGGPTTENLIFGTNFFLSGSFIFDDVITDAPKSIESDDGATDLEDNSPILFFGQTIENNGQIKLFSCFFFENAGFNAGKLCAEVNVDAFDLTGNLIINVPNGMTFQALKLIRFDKVSFPFANIRRDELVLFLLEQSPELNVKLLPEEPDVDQIILSEEVLPFDFNVQSLFINDNLNFKNLTTAREDSILVRSSEIIAVDDEFITDDIFSFSHGDDFTGCFFQNNVPLLISNDIDNAFSVLADLGSERSIELQFDLSTVLKDADLVSSIFLSKPNSNDFDIFLGCSGEALNTGAEINLESSTEVRFCIQINEELIELVDDFTLYFRQNRTIDTFLIFEVVYLADVEVLPNVQEDDTLLLLMTLTSSLLVIIGLIFILFSIFTDFLIIRKPKSEFKFEVIN